MTPAADFGYAQARMQARHGERLAEPGWAALAAVGGYSAFLAAARETPLKRRLRGVSTRADTHQLEAQLRRELLETIDEVARWVPQPWHDAVAWCAALLYLPVARSVSLADAATPWMQEAWRHWQGRLAALSAQPDLVEGWVAHWRATWPACPARSRRALEDLVAHVREHRRSLDALASADELPGRKAWARRRALAAHMRRRLRTDLMTPAAAFAYLVLEALDVERLRGELVPRRLFEARGA